MNARAGLMVFALTLPLCAALPALADDPNTTGLRLYPKNTGGMMMGGSNPNACMVYNSGSKDDLKTVTAWYVARGAGHPAITDNSYGDVAPNGTPFIRREQ